MKLFRILNTESFPHGYERRRLWLEPGQPVGIARQLFMRVFFDRAEEGYVPVIQLSGPDVEEEFPVPSSSYLYAHEWAGLVMTPRAMEISDKGRPRRILVDFCSTRRALKFAV